MKLENIDLAFALHALAEGITATHNIRVDAVYAFAQYIADHPTSIAQHPVALELLGIDDVPQEAWGQPAPEQPEGERRVAESVQRLNTEYNRSSLHAIVGLRRLAWNATQLARVLAANTKATHDMTIFNNGGKTAALFLPAPLHDDFTRDDYKKLLSRKSRTTRTPTGA